MLEIAPGVYTSLRMTSGIREMGLGRAGRLVPRARAGRDRDDLRDPAAVGEQQIRMLGEAPKEIVGADGVCLVKYD